MDWSLRLQPTEALQRFIQDAAGQVRLNTLKARSYRILPLEASPDTLALSQTAENDQKSSTTQPIRWHDLKQAKLQLSGR